MIGVMKEGVAAARVQCRFALTLKNKGAEKIAKFEQTN